MRIITEENYENLIGMINEWESMYKAAQARIAELETALQALVKFDDKNYYQRVHITQEPDVMKQARNVLRKETA